MDGNIAARTKRGRPPLSDGAVRTGRTKDDRVNVSMDRSAQEAIVSLQARLAAHLGFTPTLTQTLLWLVSRADRLIDEVGKMP